LEDELDAHYIDPSFRNGLKKIIDFKDKFSFKRSYWVVIPSPINTVDNPLPGCIAVYLEELEHGVRLPLPKVVMEILRTYDIAIALLVPNTWASILPFLVTCKLKRIECTTLAFSYVHIIQKNSKNWGKGLVSDHWTS